MTPETLNTNNKYSVTRGLKLYNLRPYIVAFHKLEKENDVECSQIEN